MAGVGDIYGGGDIRLHWFPTSKQLSTTLDYEGKQWLPFSVASILDTITPTH